jgi:hypothetical protein
VNAQTLPSATFSDPPLPKDRDTPPPATPPPPPRGSPKAASLVAKLLDTTGSTWIDEARRLAAAASMAAVFGASLGLRRGGLALAWGPMGAPLGLLAVGALAAPALGILLSLADAPVDALDLARATSRAALKAGLLLAGVAPATALFVVTVEDGITVTIMGFGALILAGTLAARSFRHDLEPMLARAPLAKRSLVQLSIGAFLLFSGALALRVWSLALPMLAVTP